MLFCYMSSQNQWMLTSITTMGKVMKHNVLVCNQNRICLQIWSFVNFLNLFCINQATVVHMLYATVVQLLCNCYQQLLCNCYATVMQQLYAIVMQLLCNICNCYATVMQLLATVGNCCATVGYCSCSCFATVEQLLHYCFLSCLSNHGFHYLFQCIPPCQ